MPDKYQVFTKDDLQHPSKLPLTLLPTKKYTLKFVISRVTTKRSHDSVAASTYKIQRNSVLPFHPLITIDCYSTRCVTIFQLLNYDIALKFFE